MIGYAFCGSFCTLKKSFAAFCEMAESGEELLPIVSENVWATDTRFQTAKDFCDRLAAVSGSSPLTAEPPVVAQMPGFHCTVMERR